MLILWGLSIIIKMIWNIDIPIFRPFLALFLIYLGLTLLFERYPKITYKSYTFTTREEKEEEL